MLELKPWHSAGKVERELSGADEAEVREWVRRNFNREFLAAGPAVVRMLLPFIDLPRVRDRAALVLYAVDHDWVDVLERAADPACGFTAAFWRDAFRRAQDASSVQCIAWLLANRGDVLADMRGDVLEL